MTSSQDSQGVPSTESGVAIFEPTRVAIINGVPMISSRDFATITQKEHYNVLKMIRDVFGLSGNKDTLELQMELRNLKDISVVFYDIGTNKGDTKEIFMGEESTLMLAARYDTRVLRILSSFYITHRNKVLELQGVQIKKLEAEVKKRTRQPAGTSKKVNVIRKVEVFEKGEVVGHVWKGMIELRENSTHAEQLKYQAMMAIRRFQRMAERLEDAGINYIPPIHLRNGNIVNPSCLNVLLSGKAESDNDEWVGYYGPSNEEGEELL